ncbi:hypothetical protein [Halohasta litorea]|uniref:GNAT family N-acetyltransferase n=1 Tax=Halohasta litorea TaxID=869891 RepID=A0ABD6DA62_9EURY|nr:hypothetical protein [Halohasta litorea]
MRVRPREINDEAALADGLAEYLPRLSDEGSEETVRDVKSALVSE